jgi:uncharacterized protein (TIGR02246 family)
MTDSSHHELLDRWVSAIEAKDLDALAEIFRNGDDLAVFWSNGERTVGWQEVRRHIEADFRKGVDLAMQIQDLHTTPVDHSTCTLTYRYDITVTAGEDAVTCSRLASMMLHRDAQGWRIASLHVSTAPDLS